MEQTYQPMYKNQIRGVSIGRVGQMTTKPISIKGAKRKFGGCVRKAVELTSGDLGRVLDSRLRDERAFLTAQQSQQVAPAQTSVCDLEAVETGLGAVHRIAGDRFPM